MGLRGQQVRQAFFDLATGARDSLYDKGAVTPIAALLFRPRSPLAVYASYAEGLGFGPTAPSDAVNAGEVFPPTRSRQVEVGSKLDISGIGASLAVFQITQPSSFTDPATRVFSVDGKQRNRGLELSVFGAPTEGVRVLGGLTVLDGELTSTVGGQFDGKTAPGVPRLQFNVYGEYDLPFAPGLTTTARVIATDRQYFDRANTQSIPAWGRLDLGARYGVRVGATSLVALFNVLNVTGEDYWVSTAQGSLSLGQPRTYLFSLSADL
jgi:iron complex outermembrane receptor protein